MADQTQQMRDLVRAVANGCPLDTAPDWVWRAYLEAMRTVARDIMATDHNADGGVMASGGEVAITDDDGDGERVAGLFRNFYHQIEDAR